MRHALPCFVFLGVAPFAAIAGYYLAQDAWPKFWHAMVGSNLAKGSATQTQYLGRAFVLVVHLFGFVITAAVGLKCLARLPDDRLVKLFLPVWLFAAVLGFFAVPNLYPHYALPLLPPLCILAALAFQQGLLGSALGLLLILSPLGSQSLDSARHRENAREMERMASVLQQHSAAGTLLVFDGPPLLHAMAGMPALSPLVFPNHLNHEIERNVSHLDTSSEMKRILAAGPDAVVVSSKPRVKQFNRESWAMVTNYIREHCTLATRATLQEIGRHDTITVYTRCNQGREQSSGR